MEGARHNGNALHAVLVGAGKLASLAVTRLGEFCTDECFGGARAARGLEASTRAG